MGPPTAFRPGQVVLIRFPFSDLSQTKLRPAVILADAGRGDWILSQVTSNPHIRTPFISLTDTSFSTGSLRLASYVLPSKLFTAHRGLIVAYLGTLKPDVFNEVVETVINIFRPSLTP